MPNNDFLAYQSYANNYSLGFSNAYDPSYLVFPFKIGYPIILSFIYKLLGTKLFLAKAFNVVLSAILGIQLYHITAKLFGERAGRISGILFCVWPAQIMYSSVLASEHLFIVLFLLTIQAFLIECEENSIKKKLIVAVLIGLLLTVTQFVRPISLLLFPVFFFYIVFYLKFDPKPRNDTLKKVSIIFIITSTYLGSLFLLNVVIYQKTQINIMHSSSGYNLLIGTNVKNNGMANDEDAKILEEFNYDFEEIHLVAKARAFERVLSNPKEFIKLIPKKIKIQWEEESYGYYWSTISLSYENTVTNIIKNSSTFFYNTSQIFYLLVIFLSIIGCIFMFKAPKYLVIILNCIFLCLVASYILFEVQSRYHFPATPILIVLSGLGAERILCFFCKYVGFNSNENETTPKRGSVSIRMISFAILTCTLLFVGVKMLGFSITQLSETGLLKYNIRFNQKPIVFHMEPILIKNVLHVPLTEFCSATGAESNTNTSNGEILISMNGDTVLFHVNSKTVIQNGTISLLKDPIPVFGKITLIPLRFVSEAFDINVLYDSATNVIMLEKHTISR